jgi:hypothetical protein
MWVHNVGTQCTQFSKSTKLFCSVIQGLKIQNITSHNRALYVGRVNTSAPFKRLETVHKISRQSLRTIYHGRTPQRQFHIFIVHMN